MSQSHDQVGIEMGHGWWDCIRKYSHERSFEASPEVLVYTYVLDEPDKFTPRGKTTRPHPSIKCLPWIEIQPPVAAGDQLCAKDALSLPGS